MNRTINPRAQACFCGVVWSTHATNHFVGRSEEGSRVRSNTRTNQRRDPTFEYATEDTSTIEEELITLTKGPTRIEEFINGHLDSNS